MNPLLDFSDLPRFDSIQAEHVSPAIDTLLAQARACVVQLTTTNEAPNWTTCVEPLTDVSERLSRAWGPVSHLNAVLNSPALRDVYNENLPKLSEFHSELGQNLALYARFKSLAAQPAWQHASRVQQKVVANSLRDFRLSGAELADKDKPRFTEIQMRLSELCAKFEQNLLDATDAYVHYIDDISLLAGVPDDALAAMAQAAAGDGKSGWKITLQFPSYFPILQYADNRALREKLYHAYVTRAAEFGAPEWDNTPLMREILRLRAEEATLLGFDNYAALSLEAKMAETPAQVISFLRDLARRAKPFAAQDRVELEAFARDTLGLSTLEAWDISYSSEKLRVARYAFSEQEVKQYFPESRVLEGLFGVVRTLYGIDVAPAQAGSWHPTARFFNVLRDGQLIGQFYLDLYARANKRGGAWMDDARGRRRLHNGQIQTPVAYLTCNFSAPVGDKPALFTHDEVITLFHEFGHGLHHLLTQVDELDVSGINGVEWDAVELPSQFMENFCWEWDVLVGMSAHVDTGAALPRTLFDKMLAAKNFQSGMVMVRQLEFSLFDMLLHSEFDVQNGDWQTLLDAVRREVAVNVPPIYNRFANSFSHIFSGGYSAGYYSYKWAEVLSADVYAAFEEEGGANPRTGQHFWNEVLAVGGSRPALESFHAFRGRAPELDALLRHNGMVAA